MFNIHIFIYLFSFTFQKMSTKDKMAFGCLIRSLPIDNDIRWIFTSSKNEIHNLEWTMDCFKQKESTFIT